jgi:uncharacterized protein YeaO (DUF488 family)
VNLKTKRVYENPGSEDGIRVLVDRLWPRGLTKEKASVDLWLIELSPSSELRSWFNHEPEKWLEFKKRYFEELAKRKQFTDKIRDLAKTQTVTLVYGAKNKEYNNAVALKEYLELGTNPV